MSNPDFENVDALRLIDQSAEPIKHINGFLKHHRIPTTHNAGDQRFVVDFLFAWPGAKQHEKYAVRRQCLIVINGDFFTVITMNRLKKEKLGGS